MAVLLVFFALVIFGYNFITDSNRVKEMAETYLSGLIGGRVSIHSATLSIFEGLRLDHVNVYVDADPTGKPDSLIFSATSLTLKYDPAKIITGQLEATQIIAQKPVVHLTENLDTRRWNFYRMTKANEQRTAPQTVTQPGKPPPLPAVLLRSAQIKISELSGTNMRDVGYEAMDGQLLPSSELGSFTFDMQTHGVSGLGPWATGNVALATGRVNAELYDFDYVRDVLPMLPKDARLFSELHDLAARVRQLTIHIDPGAPASQPHTSIAMQLNDVNLSVRPEDYLGSEDVHRRADLRRGVTIMQHFYHAGGYIPEESKQPAPAAPPEDATAKPQAEAQLASSATAGILEPADTANAPIPSFSGAPLPSSVADAISGFTEVAPIELRQGSGTFTFSEAGVDLKDVTGKVEGNAFLINGHVTGYSPDAPFMVSISSLANDTLKIPETPRYFNSLPPLVRDIYAIIHPDGECTMAMTLERKSPGSRPLFNGHVDIVDGKFACIFFPYTLRQASGRIAFGYDAATDSDFVHITGIRAKGLPYGPNHDSWIEVDGEVGPLRPDIPDPDVIIHARGSNIYSEPDIFRALPAQVRQPIKLFDADHTGKFPTFHGSFKTEVVHKAGWAWRWTFDTDLHFDDCSGKMVGFPYPVKHLAVDLHVRDGYLDIENAHMTRGDANMRVDGRVTWGKMLPPDAPPVDTVVTVDTHVQVHNLPMDKDLIAAIPPDEAVWIKRVGIGGKIDVDGHVYQNLPDPAHPDLPISKDDVRFDLAMKLHDGTLWPADGTFSVSDLSSQVHLTPESLELTEIHGRRDKADFTGEGALAFGKDAPVDLAVHINAKSLAMDAPLYEMLPSFGKANWDSIHPRGEVDADLTWRGRVAEDDPEARLVRDGQMGKLTQPKEKLNDPGNFVPVPPGLSSPAFPDLFVATLPRHPITASLPALFSTVAPGFHATLKPQGMSCTIDVLPYRIDGVRGTIVVSPEKVIITDTTAHHGKATFAVSGIGTLGERSVWDLNIAGKNLPIDDELRKALPASLLTTIDSVKFNGNIDFAFPKFVYHGDAIPIDEPLTRPSSASATTRPATPVDIEMKGGITFGDCSLDAGVPTQHVFGNVQMTSTVRGGKLATLESKLNVPKASIAERDLTDISMDIIKPADRQELYLQRIHGTLAGGPVAGEVRLSYPDDGPSRYLLSLAVRNADVATLVKDADKEIKGELTASLSLEGNWDGIAQRRGRGDVVVTGKELYHLPLMMGLFQVTNLSLPIATPFKSGTARYSIEGPRVTFENVELRSDNMLMSGTGHLDFKTRQVLMTFTTDNPNGFKIPLVNDLIKNARGELLKITIKGTIQEPKVQANSFGTVTTTIDQVFKNDAGNKGR